MWQEDAATRAKVPMPPPRASREGAPWVERVAPDNVSKLRDIAASWLRAETGRAPDADSVPAEGYEALRPCLAPAPTRLQ
jgi:hypothetical protein